MAGTGEDPGTGTDAASGATRGPAGGAGSATPSAPRSAAPSGATSPAWRAIGLIWRQETPLLEWAAPAAPAASPTPAAPTSPTLAHATVRTSPLPLGAEPAFTVGADRRCVGVWRAGRRVPCPAGAPVPARTRGAQCATCTALDRSSSIAADTRPDDPRAFAVYLAHHGSVVKVGITAEERGSTRLLEQGALSSTVVSTGTLMAARRSEHLLTTALGLPDRVAAQRKRTARARPGTPGERAAELLATAERVHALPAWPPIGQTPREPHVTDHTTAYGLPPSGLVPTAAVQPLEPGQTVTGRLACRIGSDLYLDTAAGLVLLDTRLLAGWALHPAPGDAAFTAGLEPLDDPREPQALF